MFNKRIFLTYIISFNFFILFGILIVQLKTVDVQAIGPLGSSVGLATINKATFDFFKVNMTWYKITDYLGIFALLTALAFAVLGLIQLIKRKSLKKVDYQILCLAAYYVLVFAFYILFEKVVIINYRPILLTSDLEVSFPSSHTMLIITVMSSAMYLIPNYFKNKALVISLETIAAAVIIITIIGRLISGVHWLTDIIGGFLLGFALFMLYYSATNHIKSKKHL